MRCLSTGLGAWETIEGPTKHGITFPLAIVHAVVVESGRSEPVCLDGTGGPGRASDFDVLLASVMDPRHMWRLPAWLRSVGCPVLAADRSEGDPLVVAGGQACTAPAPIEPLCDVVFVGEAEVGLAALLDDLDRTAGQARAKRLESAAALPGVLVPSCLPAGHVVQQVWAADIGISLRSRLQVNLRPLRRVEVARGCKGPASRVPSNPDRNAACAFCALGWRAPYREASASDVVAALAASAAEGVREVHLSAGDAEGHSEIDTLRQAVRDHGLRDYGWTGRLDTTADCHASAGKVFAFGLEGASHRLRRAVGKARLTDDLVVERLAAHLRAGGTHVILHWIAGLPTEGPDDLAELGVLLRRIDQAIQAERRPVLLEPSVQPFGPLPHTPMQWAAPGITTAGIAGVLAPWGRRGETGRWHVKTGQQAGPALLNALTMRGGREVALLLVDGVPRLPAEHALAAPALARHVRGYGLDLAHYLSEWPLDAALPWAHVRSAWSAETLAREWGRVGRMLGR